jgi:hypothetical protein
LLDLTAFYDRGPEGARNFFYNVLPSMHPIPLGPQRSGGIDFDLRGMAQIGSQNNDVWGSGTTVALD